MLVVSVEQQSGVSRTIGVLDGVFTPFSIFAIPLALSYYCSFLSIYTFTAGLAISFQLIILLKYHKVGWRLSFIICVFSSMQFILGVQHMNDIPDVKECLFNGLYEGCLLIVMTINLMFYLRNGRSDFFTE